MEDIDSPEENKEKAIKRQMNKCPNCGSPMSWSGSAYICIPCEDKKADSKRSNI
ncbi:hypothetical protein KAR91_43940 [Candidatus Pacearchaeota archaeon]|nr:hypothetical protein [Candidatus Pacearchaeota archaeon]